MNKTVKRKCMFCGEGVRIVDGIGHRMGVKYHKTSVFNGYIVGDTLSSMSPICTNCWQKAVNYLTQ